VTAPQMGTPNGMAKTAFGRGISGLGHYCPQNEHALPRTPHGPRPERDDQICGPKHGLTLTKPIAKAVQDRRRRCLRWLEEEGKPSSASHAGKSHTVTTRSIDNNIVHAKNKASDRTEVLFPPSSTIYDEVIQPGNAQSRLRNGLSHGDRVTVDELREYGPPLSPMPYVERGYGCRSQHLWSTAVRPNQAPRNLTRQMLDARRRHGADPPHPRHSLAATTPRTRHLSYLDGYRMPAPSYSSTSPYSKGFRLWLFRRARYIVPKALPGYTKLVWANSPQRTRK